VAMPGIRRERRHQAGITLIEVLVAMIIMSVVSAMLITVWINLQRSSAFAVSSNNARADARDAIARATNELRGAQPQVLSTATPQPPITSAGRYEVQFYSSFNSASTRSDYTGFAALQPTRIWLDTATVPPAPWSSNGRTLYLQRDLNHNGSFTDTSDWSRVLAHNVVNMNVSDSTNTSTAHPAGTSYTPVFRYAYRTTSGGTTLWTDNQDTVMASLSYIVAIRVRLIVDATSHSPNPADVSTTVRLRNASTN
jgi:prepilin-type N-terminal cleavage/methylation domain-containing protein